MKKKILIVSGPEGHLSIAQAIEQKLIDLHPILIKIREPFMFLYMPIYRVWPQFFKIPFYLSHDRLLKRLIEHINTVRYFSIINKKIDQYHPEIVIGTYFMFAPALAKICQVQKIKFISVVTDPWTIHPLSINNLAQTNLVFDQPAFDTAQKIDSGANLTITGWLVRDQFEQTYDQQQVRQKLNLDSYKFTILIAAGSEGSTTVLKILPSLLKSKHALQVVVACGNNSFMLSNIKALAKIIPKQIDTKIIPLAFEPNLHLYMQAADLVVGKAGPNTIFESVATLTPFFAITHISGQEDGNLDLIKHYQLGYVEENYRQAATVLKRIIDQPTELDRFKASIAQMAEYNRQAKTKLLSLID